MSPPPPSTSSSLSSISVTNSVVTDSGKQLACQTVIYIIVTLVIVAIICGTILLIWNDGGIAPIRRRLKIESVRSDAFLRPFARLRQSVSLTASTLVQCMIHYFLTTLLPTIRDLRRTGAGPRPQPQPEPSLPLFVAPHLAAPRPAMARDRSTSRIPLTSFARSYPPSLTATPSFPNVIVPAGSAP